jgi:Protein involved in initiation of plasmid replication
MENKSIIQSQILTCAKYNFSVYEKRILYNIVRIAQGETEGLRFPKDCRPIQHNLWNQPEVTIPIKDILLDDNDQHYTRVKAALKNILSKQIEYTDTNKTWYLFNIFVAVKVDVSKGLAGVTINPSLWDMILDFSKGFTPYELKVAMSFSSVYSMRFYELMANNKTPIEFEYNKLKSMLGLERKYNGRQNNFEARVLNPTQKDLNEKSPYTFTYRKEKRGDKLFYRFYPKFQQQFADKNLETQALKNRTCLSWDIPKNLKDYLINNCYFTQQGLKNNRDLFIEFQQCCSDCVGVLGVMKTTALANGAKNLQGYIIKAVSNYISQQQGK